MSFVYVAHLNAPDPVKPDDGAVAGVAGHQDVRQVPDAHYGAVIQVPRPVPLVPDALFCISSLLVTARTRDSNGIGKLPKIQLIYLIKSAELGVVFQSHYYP